MKFFHIIRYLMLAVIIVLLFVVAGTVLLVANPVWGATRNKDINIPVDTQQLYSHVKALTDITPARYYYNQTSLQQAALYIELKFKSYGYATTRQSYADGRYQFRNILAHYGDENAPRIVVGAHYDVCGDQPGADDNASGIAGLLEIARLCAELKPKTKYRIDFVAYSTEEPPYFRGELMGSFVHAKSLADAKTKVKLMISLEMLGFYSDEPNSQSYPLEQMKMVYPNTANFIAVVGRLEETRKVRHFKRCMRKSSDIDVMTLNVPQNIADIDLSDHRCYWEFGFPAIMITDTSFYRNPNYHQITDTIETLDFRRMAEVVKGAFYSIINIS